MLVLTGAGDSFAAGMDLKEYFRETDGKPDMMILKVRRTAEEWQWRRLRDFPKATIAMVNGWCFGGAFTPMVACDLAIAADEATFGLSEVNWGIIPAGNVTKATAETIGLPQRALLRDDGRNVHGKQAAEMGLVNESVPRKKLKSARPKLATDAARQESNGAARHQDRDEARAVHGLGSVGRLSVREDGRGVEFRREREPRERDEGVPRRQEVQARTSSTTKAPKK